MPHPAPYKPKTHGGRRPGAGGKPGNINALKHATRSPRYADAQLLLNALRPQWGHCFDLPEDRAEATELRKLYLDAAAWTLESFPEIAEYTEELISAHSGLIRSPFPGQEALLLWLEQPRDRRRPWYRALLLAFAVAGHDDTIGARVTEHLFDRFITGIRALGSRSGIDLVFPIVMIPRSSHD